MGSLGLSSKVRAIARGWASFLGAVRADKFLVLLPLVALTLGVLWAAIIPAYQTPDELAHFSYVQTLSEKGGLLPSRHLSREVTATLEVTRLSRLPFDPSVTQVFLPESAFGPSEHRIASLAKFFRHQVDPGVRNSAAGYPPGYYLLSSLAYRALASQDILTIMFGLRVFSAVLTSVTVLFSYLTLRLFFNDLAVAKTTALLIPLSPMYTYMGMAVNVDVLVWLLFSIITYLLTRALKQGLSETMNAGIASLVGLGLWVKQTFFIVVPLYFLFLVFERFRRFIVWRVILRWAIIFLGIVFLMNPAIYLRGWSTATSTIDWAVAWDWGFVGHFFDNWSSYRWALRDTFWGYFGWLDTPLASALYSVIGFVSLAGLASFLAFLVGTGPRMQRSFLGSMRRVASRQLAVFFLTVLIVFVGALSIVNYAVLKETGDWFLQGRYFFPIIGPIFAVIMTGLIWFAQGRLKQGILLATLIAMITFQVVAIFNYVIPRYYL